MSNPYFPLRRAFIFVGAVGTRVPPTGCLGPLGSKHEGPQRRDHSPPEVERAAAPSELQLCSLNWCIK